MQKMEGAVISFFTPSLSLPFTLHIEEKGDTAARKREGCQHQALVISLVRSKQNKTKHRRQLGVGDFGDRFGVLLHVPG